MNSHNRNQNDARNPQKNSNDLSARTAPATSASEEETFEINVSAATAQPHTTLTVVHEQPSPTPEASRQFEDNIENRLNAAAGVGVSSTQLLSSNRRVEISARATSPSALSALRKQLLHVDSVEHQIILAANKNADPLSQATDQLFNNFDEQTQLKNIEKLNSREAARFSQALSNIPAQLLTDGTHPVPPGAQKSVNSDVIGTINQLASHLRNAQQAPYDTPAAPPDEPRNDSAGATNGELAADQSAADKPQDAPQQHQHYTHRHVPNEVGANILRTRHQANPSHSPLDIIRDELSHQLPATIARINALAGQLAGTLGAHLPFFHPQAKQQQQRTQPTDTTATASAAPQPAEADETRLWQKLINKQPVRSSEIQEQFTSVNVDMHEAIVRAFADDAQEEPPLPLYNAVVQQAYTVVRKVHRKNVQYTWMHPSHPVVLASAARLKFLDELNKRVIDLI